MATNDLLTRKTKQYPKWYLEERRGRLLQDIKNGKIVQDCVGLIKGYYWTREDGSMKYGLDGRPDKGANGMFNAATEKGPIDSMPEIIGLILHMEGHVGVYIGRGWVVHAKGFRDGVVLTRVCDGKWTSWFKCPYIDYIDEADIYSENPDDNLTCDMFRVLSYDKTNMVRGADVSQVQEMLLDMGFEVGLADGIFGPRTEAAVRAFQQEANLSTSGIVDQQTWDVMLQILALEDDLDPAEFDTELDADDTDPKEMEPWESAGSHFVRLLRYMPGETMMRGEDVRKVQDRLSQKVFGVGKIDGIYGPRTVAAVRAFQVSVGIEDDGIVGPETIKVLFA